jgi:hypothetical protein
LEKIHLLKAITDLYTSGLFNISTVPGITRSDMDYIIDSYGTIITSGMDDSFPRITFRSATGDQPRDVVLEMDADDGYLDMLIDTYHSALEQGLIRPPENFMLSFNRHEICGLKPQQNGHKNMCLKLYM